MSQKNLKNTFVSFTQILSKIATRNVTKNLKKIFLLFVPGSREFCHWKCHQKIQKNSFSLVVLDILDFCPWKCHKKFNQYSFSVFIPDNNFATENVTKILQEI